MSDALGKRFSELAGNTAFVTFQMRTYDRACCVTLDLTAVHSGFSDELPLRTG